MLLSRGITSAWGTSTVPRHELQLQEVDESKGARVALCVIYLSALADGWNILLENAAYSFLGDPKKE